MGAPPAVDLLSRCVIGVIGISLSVYSLYVKKLKTEDEDYEALCDINESISCSAVFTSEYGKGFGIMHYFVSEDNILNQSNSLYGIPYFAIQLLGCVYETPKVAKSLWWMTVVGILSCVYLAYILYFVLHDMCVVCLATYFCTALLHHLNRRACKRMRALKTKEE